MPSIFTQIINKEIPCYKIAENQEFIAFLDINPNTKGHVLCVPKVVRDKFFDLDEATFNQLMTFSRKVALAIRIAIPCERIGMSVIGLEVPHAHVHLIPLHTMEDISFQNKAKISQQEMETTAKAIAIFFENQV